MTVLTRKALHLSLLMGVIMSRTLTDAVIWIDGLVLKKGESVEDISKLLHSHFDIRYPVKWEVMYREELDD